MPVAGAARLIAKTLKTTSSTRRVAVVKVLRHPKQAPQRPQVLEVEGAWWVQCPRMLKVAVGEAV